MTWVRETLEVLEFYYPFADKINPILQGVIERKEKKESNPSQIKAMTTLWDLDGEKEVQPLLKWITDILFIEFLGHVPRPTRNTYFKLVECWGIHYKKGDSIDQHDHVPSQYSFTYYVNVPKGSSPLVFTTSKHKVIPKPGKLVMFESRLQHKVPPCKCDDRFAIAGNFRHAGEKGTYGRG